MKGTDFLDRIARVILTGGGPNKVEEIEIEALNYYAQKIVGALSPMNKADVPYVVTVLDKISDNFKTAYPDAKPYIKALSEIKFETIIIQAPESEVEELMKDIGGEAWN